MSLNFAITSFFLSVCFAFCSLGGRLVWLQVLESERFTDVAENARKNFSTIKARRGDIVDSKGNSSNHKVCS